MVGIAGGQLRVMATMEAVGPDHSGGVVTVLAATQGYGGGRRGRERMWPSPAQ